MGSRCGQRHSDDCQYRKMGKTRIFKKGRLAWLKRKNQQDEYFFEFGKIGHGNQATLFFNMKRNETSKPSHRVEFTANEFIGWEVGRHSPSDQGFMTIVFSQQTIQTMTFLTTTKDILARIKDKDEWIETLTENLPERVRCLVCPTENSGHPPELSGALHLTQDRLSLLSTGTNPVFLDSFLLDKIRKCTFSNEILAIQIDGHDKEARFRTYEHENAEEIVRQLSRHRAVIYRKQPRSPPVHNTIQPTPCCPTNPVNFAFPIDMPKEETGESSSESIYDIDSRLDRAFREPDTESMVIVGYVRRSMHGQQSETCRDPGQSKDPINIPPPCPPRRQCSQESREYANINAICQTLNMALTRTPPLPDTLKLPISKRSKLCYYLYMSENSSWKALADHLGLSARAVMLIQAFQENHPSSNTAAEIILRYWQYAHNNWNSKGAHRIIPCTKKNLLKVLQKMNRNDIIDFLK